MTRSLSRRSLLLAAGGIAVMSAALPGLAMAADKPALFLIGDSTTRNGTKDNGDTAGQFGWGHMLHYYFDTSRISVVNDAMGGTSSRSFQVSPKLWPLVVQMIRPGDYVLMAFGHNDSRGSLPGNGEDTAPVPPPPPRRMPTTAPGTAPAAPGVPGTAPAAPASAAPATNDAPINPAAAAPAAPAGPPEMMHSFGWYMRQYVEQVKAKGATPIVLSLIPRNRWTDGKVNRNDKDYALWAQQAAEQEHVQFIPLNDMIADVYDQLGQAKVQADLFPPNEAVHPNWAGASLNASLVVEGIKKLDTPLKQYLVKNPQVPATPDVIPPNVGEMGPSAMAPTTRTPQP
jgi:lysophospholipase L1-like esterase